MPAADAADDANDHTRDYAYAAFARRCCRAAFFFFFFYATMPPDLLMPVLRLRRQMMAGADAAPMPLARPVRKRDDADERDGQRDAKI